MGKLKAGSADGNGTSGGKKTVNRSPPDPPARLSKRERVNPDSHEGHERGSKRARAIAPGSNWTKLKVLITSCLRTHRRQLFLLLRLLL